MDKVRDIVTHESRLARRLGRLFRFERLGLLSRRSASLTLQLRHRRGDLVEALMKADAARRALHIAITPELRQAAEALWRETSQSLDVADSRLDGLRIDLLMARGEGMPSGMRGAGAGRIVGSG